MNPEIKKFVEETRSWIEILSEQMMTLQYPAIQLAQSLRKALDYLEKQENTNDQA